MGIINYSFHYETQRDGISDTDDMHSNTTSAAPGERERECVSVCVCIHSIYPVIVDCWIRAYYFKLSPAPSANPCLLLGGLTIMQQDPEVLMKSYQVS